MVLDLVVGVKHPPGHKAMVCNSPATRLYSGNLELCWPLDTYTVLCLATYPGDTSIMASVGEDREARVWRLEQDRLEGLVVGSGHIEALGGLSWGAELSLLV